MANSILTLLTEYILQHLQTKMVDEVSEDEMRAGAIKFGLLHDDPSEARIALQVLLGGDDWPDKLATEDDEHGLFAHSAYELGGGFVNAYWWRRFRLEVTIFLDNEEDLLSATSKANVIISRLHKALMQMEPGGLADDFGEVCHSSQVAKMGFYQSGDDGTFIWRGTVYLEFLTSVTNA